MFLLVCWSRIADMYQRTQGNWCPFKKKVLQKVDHSFAVWLSCR